MSGSHVRRGKPFSVKRVGLYAFLVMAAIFFALPLFVMVTTSLKSLPEINSGMIFSLPVDPSLETWSRAWSSACTGLNCQGMQVGFWNSVKILIPSVVLSVAIGSVNGYVLSFWNFRGANLVFACLMTGAFVPYQVYMYPLVRMYASVGLFGTLPGIVLIHTIFGLPSLTLIFRNYFVGLPIELYKAARIDGAGFWRIFVTIMLPLSMPILIVAVIFQVTSIWNDFQLGLIFAGSSNLPMTVQLNNIVNSEFGAKQYNLDMAATLITALVPLAVYFLSGKWFVRGVAAGALKG
ncbi:MULTISPECIES: carbohydrate ABC transporter permease [Rhizobium/Agrobacterium group]|uniref:ABC transporter n=2 Tax=Rhizobium/Agrobacterium group TaxID=227290 RepID=B9K3P5_ALLAM|nr:MULTISPECIES: carbohydrate ABC transporter permease [Rhizobium/Agrobacterium group]ACM39493.1 ABC transporter [Allorhizobium ampelinum S4]MCF1448991.1 carbohydrate ABC transporter permease [Allorhizobium ampelinum]MCM2450265.1 carbohydrate ABC transporter permease [Agrobacterium vitis]MCM2471340.1 carbohydrate ABC transporter permease [Agrobacterium vitis]MUO31289.1 ABC transporter permease subunit [Agrobacterium vitis]